jgi:hypothetical protein
MASQLVSDVGSNSSSLPQLFHSSQVITRLAIFVHATKPLIRSQSLGQNLCTGSLLHASSSINSRS